MKLSYAIAAAVLFALALLSGCPKSNNMLDHSRKSGALQTQPATNNGELTQGTPPAGGAAAAPPPATDNSGSSGNSSGSGSSGGGDKNGGGSDDEGEG